MRKNKQGGSGDGEFSILAVDDDKMMTLTLQAYFRSAGYRIDIENDPEAVAERVKNGGYDIMLLDFLMSPICGDKVVERVREFDADLYIILLTGHKSMAPPIRTMRELDIQGYYEKSDRFDQLELLVESCVKSIKQMRTIKDYHKGLTGLMEESPHIYKLQPMRDMMEAAACGAKNCFQNKGGYVYLAECGAGESIFVGDEALREQAETDFLAVVNNEKTDNGLRMVQPLVNEAQKTFGVIGLLMEKPCERAQLQMLELFARQVSAALGNAMLHTQVSEKNTQLERAHEAINNNYVQVTETIRKVVDARDDYTRGHSDRVAKYAVLLAKALGKSEKYQKKMMVAGLFHDVGKIGIPDEILFKTGRLTDEEYNVIKTHSARGVKILSGIDVFEEIIPAVEGHHERIDGRGYPRGLKGEQICEDAKLIAIVDAFDAMVSHRRYRRNLTLDEAREQIVLGKGTQFDAEMADVFLKLTEQEDEIEKVMTMEAPR